MATYETAMYDDTMFEHPDDTEMAVDQGKYIHHDGDIDIDFDVVEHVPQDEMMMEDHPEEATYDLELGDVVPEQDAEMTDESAEDEILDEEITDAPVEQIPEQINTSEDRSTLLHESQQLGNTTMAPSLEGTTAQFLHADQTAVSPEAPHGTEGQELNTVSTMKSIEDIKTPGDVPDFIPQQEVEELITWESDDDEEGAGETKGTGDIAPADQNLAVNQTETQQTSELQGEKLQQSPNNAGEKIEGAGNVAVIDQSLNGGDASNKPVAIADAEELISYEDYEDEGEGEDEDNDKEEPNTVEQTDLTEVENESREKESPETAEPAEYSGKHGEDLEAEVSKTAEEVETEDTLRTNQTQENAGQSAIEQLHSIVINYMGQEMSLFPPREGDGHVLYFLEDKKLAFDTCENLFKAFRKVLGDNITKHESLILNCSDLGLEINEGIPETSTLSIAQLFLLHLGLLRNEGHDDSSPLLIELRHCHDVSARLNELYALMGEGKGYAALSNHGKTAEIDHSNGVTTSEDVENVNDSETILDDGYATPKYRQHLNIQDDEPDFSSPAATHTASRLDLIDSAAKIEDTAQPSTDPAGETESVIADTHEEYEINYEDEEDEETSDLKEASEETANDVHGTLTTVAPDTSTALNTNLQADQAITRYETTNNRDESGSTGTEKLTALPEDDDANNNNEKRNIGTEQPQQIPEGVSDPVNTGTEIETTAEATGNIDDFDDIDYSDHESDVDSVKPSDMAPNVSLKPASPKRTIDEVEDSTRDTKRLRSS